MRVALARLPAVSHYISNAVPPTHCPVCLQEHGFGDRNQAEAVASKVTLDAHQRAALVGSYRAREDGRPVRVEADGEILFLAGGDQRLQMYARTPTRFLVPGNVLPVHFELDAKGSAARMVEDDIEPYIYDRVADPAPAKAKKSAKH